MFIITGSGRCGTTYMAKLLNAVGVKCGHETVYYQETNNAPKWSDYQADASWQAVPFLHKQALPVVLITRHPLSVVRSLVQIGFFSNLDKTNPVHRTLRQFAPEVYSCPTDHEKALTMWYALNSEALRYAELRFKIETFGYAEFERLLRWSGCSTSVGTAEVFDKTAKNINNLDGMKARTRAAYGVGIDRYYQWSDFTTKSADRALRLATNLGYKLQPE